MSTEKKKLSYRLFFVSDDSRNIKKINVSEKRIRLLVSVVVMSFFFFIFNIVGFWYYRSLYSSLEKDRLKVMAFDQERTDLVNKVAMLEKTVGDTEMLADKLTALVGPERVQQQRGVGPIPTAARQKFELLSKTSSLSLGSMDPKINHLEERAVDLQTRINELYQIQEDRMIYMASTPSIWPVKGWVTSEFGMRRSPFTLAPDFHGGIDIAASWGTSVTAAADGVVTFAGYKGGLGKAIIIDHGFGVSSYYGHTSSLLVHEGEKIKRGAKIALVGNTGHSTGSHLHYEIHVDGVPVDPMKYILQ